MAHNEVDGLTEEEVAEMKDAFAMFDKNGDNRITTSELGTVLRSLGWNPTDTELEEMVKDLDVDNSNAIEFHEFTSLMSRPEFKRDPYTELKNAFEVFDTDHNGYITLDELRHIVTCLGTQPLSEEECQAMMEIADTNNDNKIDYSEFCKMFFKK